MPDCPAFAASAKDRGQNVAADRDTHREMTAASAKAPETTTTTTSDDGDEV